MWLAAVAVLALLIVLLLRRANELCAVELSNDGARLLRGRAPGQMLADVAEVARLARPGVVTVRVVVESASPRLIPAASLPEAVVQQLRNVVGQYRVVHFRTGRRGV